MSSFYLVLPDLSQWSVADLEALKIYNDRDLKRGSIDLNDIRYPKLAAFHIRGVHKISGFSSSLRIFDCAALSMTVTETWELLSRCPSLEVTRLALTGDDGSSRRPDSVPLIQPQHLRSLVLESASGVREIPFSTFIEALALPVIEKLWVFDVNALVTWSSTAFQALAHRSNYFPHLRDIVLGHPAFVVDAGALLESMPSLKSMSLSWGIYNNIVFDHFVL
ncbi:hypothetical protein M378DRAFT_166317, partial [Amanita muscaria Koide BX008]